MLVTKFHLVMPALQALFALSKQSFLSRYYQAELGSELYQHCERCMTLRLYTLRELKLNKLWDFTDYVIPAQYANAIAPYRLLGIFTSNSRSLFMT